jgi:hypothetical protein
VNTSSPTSLKPLERVPTAKLSPLHAAGGKKNLSSEELKTQFSETVGTIFYTQMMKAMRSTSGETKYLNGGQAEKMFQSQLDQVVVDALAKRGDNHFADSMYTAFEAGVHGGVAKAESLKSPQSEKSTGDRSISELRMSSTAANSTQSERQNLSEQLADLARQTQTLREAPQSPSRTTELSSMIRK